jgi:hypothetical protein
MFEVRTLNKVGFIQNVSTPLSLLGCNKLKKKCKPVAMRIQQNYSFKLYSTSAACFT